MLTRAIPVLFSIVLGSSLACAQNTFEITIPVPGLTNVAGGQPLSDGGFVFGGELNDGVVVVRTDSTGGVLWTRALAEAANEEGIYSRSIAVSGERIFMGGYAMGPGTATRDGIVHVLDLDGNVLGQRLIDVAGGSNAVHSMSGTDDGALIAGRREGAGSYDMLLQQMDIDGNITGSWSYGSTGWDWAYEAIALDGGGMAVVGYGDDVGGPAPSAYLVKTDAQGNELWARGLDGASADEAYCVLEDAVTGDLYMGGNSLGMGAPGMRGFISKFNGDGTHQWTRVVGNAFDVIGLAPLTGGGFAALVRAQNIAGGQGNYDALLLRFSADGELLGNRLYGSPGSEYPVSLARAAGGGFLITSFKSGGGSNAIHAVLTDATGMGGCTGTSVVVDWSAYTPALFNHSSTAQSGSSMSSWIAPGTQPSLTRQFVCCTYPVEATFTAAPGNDPLTWDFTSTSSGAGALTWNIAGVSSSGPEATHTFPATGQYQVCLTLTGVCDTDTECQSITVLNTGVEEGEVSRLRVAPNPASTELRVEAAGGERIRFVE
ncbi:MAG TPA: PKD domain-containing protein, partial [Flavobacteriales bacterium]|nr:PKD domain-containing protein [Flavobacteriales bacterium]